MAQIKKDDKLKLKTTINRLDSIISEYNTEYKRLSISILFIMLFVLMWVSCALFYFLGNNSGLDTYVLILGAIIFVVCIIYMYILQRYSIKALKDLSNQGEKQIGALIAFVDWGVFRKKQLYDPINDIFDLTVQNFRTSCEKILSPTRSGIKVIYVLIGIITLLCVYITSFVFVSILRKWNIIESPGAVFSKYTIHYLAFLVIYITLLFNYLTLLNILKRKKNYISNNVGNDLDCYLTFIHCIRPFIQYEDSNIKAIECKTYIQYLDSLYCTNSKPYEKNKYVQLPISKYSIVFNKILLLYNSLTDRNRSGKYIDITDVVSIPNNTIKQVAGKANPAYSKITDPVELLFMYSRDIYFERWLPNSKEFEKYRVNKKALILDVIQIFIELFVYVFCLIYVYSVQCEKHYLLIGMSFWIIIMVVINLNKYIRNSNIIE